MNIELVCQAAYAAPEYGGNQGTVGWSQIHFEGDSQPLGYSLWDAANGVYRAVVKNAPAIYPAWAQWQSEKALDMYIAGLEAEVDSEGSVAERYTTALNLYSAAREVESGNMLVQLRIANCYERLASSVAAAEATAKRLEALNAYVAVRLRYPSIFEARYRASVVLARLATAKLSEPDADALRTVVTRLENDRIGDPDPITDRDRSGLQKKLRAEKQQSNPKVESDEGDTADLKRRAAKSARKESKAARRSLRPMWTLLHEGRFRYVYEPTGSERRRLRRALGISRMCLRVREHGPQTSGLRQMWWRARVFWCYFAGRPGVAGWQAHYNAACFYALLPRASKPGVFLGSAGVRRIALKHLSRAINDPDETLGCSYVRDEDLDLQTLRQYSPIQWQNDIVTRICPLE